jgi:hypothetical protein
MSADLLLALLAPLPTLLEQDLAGESTASWPGFGAVCAAYLRGRCGRADVLRAAAAYRAQRDLPADLLELGRSAG